MGNFPFISWALIATLQVMLLLSAAFDDVAKRLIPNGICLTIALTSLIGRLLVGPQQLAISLALAIVLFIILLLLHSRHILGGGDVKLLTALAIGLSPFGVVKLFAVTALAGGVVALSHLAMRCLRVQDLRVPDLHPFVAFMPLSAGASCAAHRYHTQSP